MTDNDQPFTLVDELPESRRGGHGDKLLMQFAQVLRDNPGKWGAYPKPQTGGIAYTTSWAIRERGRASFPLGQFDARVREGKLYVRYIGGQR